MRSRWMTSRFFGLLATAVIASLFLTAGNRGVQATMLEFDQELTALHISGGPFAIPLASDPTNSLGDSIDGYGFVNSDVNLTLSSQRAVNPGPRSFGLTQAFTGACAPAGPCAPLSPINPAALDGQAFFVDSFFDVFFDITVTDVDSRTGRDFAGQADGASITLQDTGPSNWSSSYTAVFDKDASTFGLVPPPEANPIIGDLLIEIPLGGDINGNGENDKIKITLGVLAISDQNRNFITLPDGTVIIGFDAARLITAAVVDESTDPPFTIGTTLPNGLPDPASFGGPGTMNSLLNNPLVSQVPEPATLGLFVIGLIGLGTMRRRRQNN